MCEFHDARCNVFGDMWWTDKCTYFSSIDYGMLTYSVRIDTVICGNLKKIGVSNHWS